MKTVNRSKRCSPTITYCAGSTKKKAAISARWSLRVVRCSVMNSRRQKNENSPASKVEPTAPLIQASQNSSAPIQAPLRSRLNWARAPRGSTCRLSTGWRVR
jgi:hypothetical protein